MRGPLLRFVSTVLVNVVALGLAALLFDRFRVSLPWFVVAVVAYSVAGFFLRRLRVARGSAILGGLLLTFAALVVTTVVVPDKDFAIDGWPTWIGVTALVWAAGVAFGEVDRRSPADAPGTRLS